MLIMPINQLPRLSFIEKLQPLANLKPEKDYFTENLSMMLP